MAHQIETHNGKAAFVTANIPAWHRAVPALIVPPGTRRTNDH